MVVCIDTNVLIWGIRQTSTEGQEAMIKRAEGLFHTLDDQGDFIMVPTPILSEYLLGMPDERHADVVKFFTTRFQVPPLDAASAAKAAQLWKAHNGGPLTDSDWLKGVARKKLKADVHWVAIAIVHGASVIYSNDSDIPKIAQGQIDVRELPEYKEQGSLLDTAT